MVGGPRDGTGIGAGLLQERGCDALLLAEQRDEQVHRLGLGVAGGGGEQLGGFDGVHAARRELRGVHGRSPLRWSGVMVPQRRRRHGWIASSTSGCASSTWYGAGSRSVSRENQTRPSRNRLLGYDGTSSG